MEMLETAFALRPVLFRALDAPTSGASLCSWSIHHRHDAGDAAQSDLRDFCNRPERVISHRVAAAILTYYRKKLPCTCRAPAERASRGLAIAHFQHNLRRTNIGHDCQPAETGDHLPRTSRSTR